MNNLNIDFEYAIEHGIIDYADVLESTKNMKKAEILKKHGDKIKLYGKDWCVRIPDATLEQGVFRCRSKDRKRVEEKLCEYYMDLEKKQKEVENKNNTTLEELFYEFMEYKKGKVSNDTIRRMMVDWKKFYEPNKEFIHMPFKTITRIDVDNFLNDIVNRYEMKNKAFCNMCGILKQTYEYAVNAEYITRSPYRVEVNKKKIIPNRKKPSEKEVFTIKEKEMLLEEMERRISENPTNNVPFAIMLDFEIGLRCGEILALKESDIVMEKGIYKIHVCRQLIKDSDITDLKNVKGNGYHIVEYTKSDCGDRFVPLTEKALEYIRRIKQTNETNGKFNEGYLFLTKDGTTITEGAVDGQLRNGCEKINIPVRSMHKIRKTYASTLYQRGVSITIISKMLGHADESTTLKHYIFNIADTTETDTLVLNALAGTEHTNSTISSKKSVTNGDNKIVQFPENEKRKTPSKIRAFR